jgi:signal transduction histidine kinase
LRAVLHEVSNPLTIVRNSLYVLAAKVGEQAAEELRVLREETERASRILQRLAEPEEPLAESGFDLNKTIRDLARVLDEALCRPHGLGLSLNLQEGLAPLTKGRDAIRQIVLNLVRNAAEALGERGHISVTTQDGINLHGRLYVEIAVADDGPGFPEELRARLFQPVTSAKGEGHAGLGLSIVKNLVDELGGLVSCRPNLEGGTVFLILLPQPNV